MTFISYAQNLEDVMLYRALKHVKKGFYIDVGSQDPLTHSVTNAFYKLGWRGINIEPVRAFWKKLEEGRPEDTSLNLALSNFSGELEIFDFPDTGLSTVCANIAKAHQQNEFECHSYIVECRTLNDVVQEYAEEVVHFLKIDVEGHEKEVLEGGDFDTFRPWIVVVEATEPLNPTGSSTKWERLLLDCEYQMAYFDGLNNFYVAQEHCELLEKFKMPPNVFDEYVIYPFHRIQIQHANMEASVHAMYNSTSWKVTAPLRKFGHWLSQLQINHFLCKLKGLFGKC